MAVVKFPLTGRGQEEAFLGAGNVPCLRQNAGYLGGVTF